MCAIIKNPLQRDGTSQEERLAKALLPGYAKIDDRTIEEIIAFASGFSKLINYYNVNNTIDGDWACFYDNDPCILLALLATIDTDSIEEAFATLEDKIRKNIEDKDYGNYDEDNNDPVEGYYDEIINLIFWVAKRIQKSCKKLPAGHVLKDEIIALIKNDLHLSIIDNRQQDALIKLIGYDKASIQPSNDYSPFIKNEDNKHCECTKAWQLDQEGYDCIIPDNSFDLASLKGLFYIFFIALLRIKQKAKVYFEECIEKNDSHQPHVTLFLTFLYLLGYAIDHLNTLTRSHLLYYFEKVLCLHKKKEIPDKVHIIFELAKNFDTHLVEEGVLLNAGKDNTSKQRVYTLLEEVVVNRAKVEQIKTVYIDEVDELSNLPGVVHAAYKADTRDGIEEAFGKGEQVQFNPLGGPGNPPTEVGFALASPMFFLKEGLRAAMISYKLKTTANVRPDAFRLQYSSEKEWIEIEDVFDAANRILSNYPLLKDLYDAKLPEIIALINEGFNLIKAAYDEIYSPVHQASNLKRDLSTRNLGRFFEDSGIEKKSEKLKNDIEAEITALRKKGPELDNEISSLRNDILATRQVYISRVDDTRKELDFLIITNTIAAPFTPLQTDEKNPGISSGWPIIKTLVKNRITDGDGLTCQYNAIKDIQLSGVDIKVAAYGLKDLVVQNDTAILDNSKEILPFSNKPYRGSYFYIGSKEVFQKKLDLVGVQLEWGNLPQIAEQGKDEFETYYKNYLTTNITNNSFTTDVEILNGGFYHSIAGARRLSLFPDNFSDDKTFLVLGIEQDDEGAKGTRDFKEAFKLRSFGRDPYLPDFADNNVNVRRGLMRLTLASKDFLHDEYPKSLLKLVVGATKPLEISQLINEPYTPKLRNTSLFYLSTERTVFGPNQYNAGIEEFYHITPFGYERMPILEQTVMYLLPQFELEAKKNEFEKDGELTVAEKIQVFSQGNLYIGLKDARAEQKINILFQVLEGSGDNRYAPPDVEWQYLVGNKWNAFKPFEIQDHTRSDESSRKSLLKSGIIEFSLRKDINSEGATILDSQFLWIRACAHEDQLAGAGSSITQSIQRIAALPNLVAIIAQAGIAQFENHDNSLSHLALPLPGKTISKFMNTRAAVKTVSQPYYSFDGRLPEDDYQFYRRISERLRHKNRAICIWDYERIVLEQFPDLHKAKCLNHTDILENREIAPGFVTISVIPDLRNKNAANKLEPRVPIGVLDDIKSFMKKRTNLFVASAFTAKLDYLQVVNPLYEQVKVRCCVRFYTGLDVAYYKYVLNDDLKKFLAPWAFDSNKEITFGSVYHKSAILNFIEERKYVDVVLGFSVEHYKDDIVQPDYDADRIIPTTSRSILTSYNTVDEGQEYEHEIEFVEYDPLNPCKDCLVTTA